MFLLVTLQWSHMNQKQWKMSLHGGHSGEFCEHARGRLGDILKRSGELGFAAYGVSEHAPRTEERFLYPEEVRKGFTCGRLMGDFERYAETLHALCDAFDDGPLLLRGFEAEVVPMQSYGKTMRELRQRFDFQYIVGSVHYVDEIQIDGPAQEFERAMRLCGGLEKLCIRYYQTVAAMVEELQPEIVGHLDLVRKNGSKLGALDTPAIRHEAQRALEIIARSGAILDLNTAAYRKGLHCPYPEPWLLQTASQMGIGVCFGDDSHSPEEVGAGLIKAREYLLENGIREITGLTLEQGMVRQKTVAL